jgi:phthiocerol/phenolphthiocerol synthesis type-I polyketide synthase D
MLDAALQCLAAALPDESLSGSATGAEEATYLPVSLESIRVFGGVGRRARGYAELVSHDDGGILGRVTLTDETGTTTAELSGIYLQRVQRRTVPLPLSQKIFDTEWIDVPVPAQPPEAADGSWLVLTDGSESEALAADFGARFASESRRVITADLTSEAAVREAFSRTADDPDRPPVGVLVFAARSAFDGTEADNAPARGRQLSWAVASTVRTIVAGWHGTAPRLWLVGRNGLTVAADEFGDPSICALKGLVRVLAYEHPDLHTGVVDLDAGNAAADPAAALITELGLAGTDDVVAWRGERRYAERLKRASLSTTGAVTVRGDGAYVLTGGLGGIGLVVARWLIDQGAARIVLNSRSQPSEEQRAVLDELGERAQIAVVSGDLASPGVAESLVASAEETGCALRGVIHGAAVIDDQIVVGIDQDTLDRVWAPKATGALRLHVATAGKDLDWWVGFSSTSSLLGAPGQASYAAASAWLDGLVAWRRAAGLPAITINWGQWSGVGVAQELKFSALDPIDPAEGMEALEAILGGDLARIGVARLRLDRVAAAFPELQQLGYFATLAEELDLDSEDDDWPGPEGLKQLDAAEAAKVVVARLGSRITAIMGYPKGSVIDPARPLTELGMDSLMAVRIRNTVRGDFGAEPPVALLLQGASLTDLAADLIRQLGLAAPEGAADADDVGGVRSRAQQRAAARQRAASRRKVGDRT